MKLSEKYSKFSKTNLRKKVSGTFKRKTCG